jgi:steroid 5-alpha reductase family enzyme
MHSGAQAWAWWRYQLCANAQSSLLVALLVMTTAWEFGLGIHITCAALAVGWRDAARYEKMLLLAKRAAAHFTYDQKYSSNRAVLFIVCSPCLVAFLRALTGYRAVIGNDHRPHMGRPTALWCVGIFFEWVGDWQLKKAIQGQSGRAQ